MSRKQPTWYFRNKEQYLKRKRQYMLENPEKVRECQHRAAKKLYDIKRKIVSDFKNKPCVDCGNSFHPCQMDLDHIKGNKIDSIGQSLKRFSTEKLLEELEKCEVVCSNCHRLRTWIHSHN